MSGLCQVEPLTDTPRGFKMLTDVILEEEFDKSEEAWYDPQDLEHGKCCSGLRSHPKLCPTVWTDVLLLQQNNVTEILSHQLWHKLVNEYTDRTGFLCTDMTQMAVS